MKKVFVTLALIACGTAAFAQAAALRVRNFNTNCGVYVSMTAAAPSEGDGTCQISGCTFYVPASTTTGYAYTSLSAFSSGPGFCYEYTPISSSTLTTLTDWNWTDVGFQWDCAPGCDGNGGGAMSEPGTLCPVSTCHGATGSWSGVGCTAGTSTWTSSLSGGSMANVAIDFH